ncbi:unnamed protein product [Mytilus edulis]|uniref:ALOG domain-containing protein n=1 Tax=Mytilus edulis TaxID=6550 RepID=A0A8S3PMR2_MYTED|nr:unnamed protein product [Mytilus edulis]
MGKISCGENKSCYKCESEIEVMVLSIKCDNCERLFHRAYANLSQCGVLEGESDPDYFECEFYDEKSADDSLGQDLESFDQWAGEWDKMLLQRDLKFNLQKMLDLIMKFHENEHNDYDQLNSFKEDEDLRTLDVDTLKLRLEKSLGIQIDDLSTCADSLLKNKDTINDRISELEILLQSTKYSKQKDSLRDSLVSFLSNLEPKRTLDDALPSDIRRFLVVKDASGKTQIHIKQCENKGKNGKFSCGCPCRLSAGSVDSLIGQIHAIFRDNGRGGDWNEILKLGNPAGAPMIKRYLSAVRLEQSLSATSPKRAVPLLFF